MRGRDAGSLVSLMANEIAGRFYQGSARFILDPASGSVTLSGDPSSQQVSGHQWALLLRGRTGTTANSWIDQQKRGGQRAVEQVLAVALTPRKFILMIAAFRFAGRKIGEMGMR
jgi:hypothetical protein